mgnify:CR=1 FL=1
MAVALRLSRGGSKKRPFYRIVAADVRSPRDGRFIERLGTYNPMKTKDDAERLNINKERIKYWLSVGAKPTNRVAKFIAKEGLGEMPKVFPQTKKDKPRPKTIEKNKAKEEKVKKAASAPETAPAKEAASASEAPPEAAPEAAPATDVASAPEAAPETGPATEATPATETNAKSEDTAISSENQDSADKTKETDTKQSKDSIAKPESTEKKPK